jgi:hypothetical protein
MHMKTLTYNNLKIFSMNYILFDFMILLLELIYLYIYLNYFRNGWILFIFGMIYII